MPLYVNVVENAATSTMSCVITAMMFSKADVGLERYLSMKNEEFATHPTERDRWVNE